VAGGVEGSIGIVGPKPVSETPGDVDGNPPRPRSAPPDGTKPKVDEARGTATIDVVMSDETRIALDTAVMSDHRGRGMRR
jgi:hypothetical protein